MLFSEVAEPLEKLRKRPARGAHISRWDGGESGSPNARRV